MNATVSSLHRCGRQASRSPGLSRQRSPQPAIAASGRGTRPAPLIYCELDWLPGTVDVGPIRTWADTHSLRLSHAAGSGTGAGAGTPHHDAW